MMPKRSAAVQYHRPTVVTYREDVQTVAVAQPTFSVVVPLYRTARYLPDLLASFDRQRRGNYTVEFIFVDDGSDDESGDIAQKWLDESGSSGTLIRQQNAGVAAARNRGIEAAAGSWITFPDSDDFLSDDYFFAAAAVLEEVDDDLVLLSGNVRRFYEATGRKSDEHPLRTKFSDPRRVIDLTENSTFIQTQTASAFFRMDVINKNGIRFVDGLRVAEDAVFASAYLLAAPTTLVAPLKESIYFYRRRAAANSAADTYRTNPDFYFGRFERGYIPLLEPFSESEPPPEWLENVVLYDLGWLFPREMNVERKATHLSEGEKDKVIGLLKTILAAVSQSTIIDYRLTAISPEVRALMLTLGGKPLPPAGTARLSKNVPGSFELCYLYQGELPAERLESRGRVVEPLIAKVRRLDYFGQEELKERIIRLPALSSITLHLDGQLQLLQYGGYYLGSAEARSAPRRQSAASRPGSPIWKQVAIRGAEELVCWTKAPVPKPAVVRRGNALRATRHRAFIQNLAKSPRYREKYAGAWLVMDKLLAGNDNGEYLYNYLTRERPDINAWFVLKKGTPEWDRLSREGFRLIDYRSIEHKVALQCAAVVASSQLDIEMEQPVPRTFYPRGRRPWRFVYLEHGVLQHNLAHWFNGKDIDLMTTASVDEHDSIVADGTTYRLTSDSVKLTGFPRHDVVVEAASKYPYEQRSIVLVAPTWRNSLFLPKPSFGARRRLRAPFMETEYGQNWMQFLSHPELERLAAEEGAEIVYLPHPNLRGNAPDVTYPDHVRVIESAPNIHELMSQARVTITDYSSIFFDAALAKSRIVFFQFDQEHFLKGGHTYMPGYWDYSRHGFGPITTSVDEAVSQSIKAYGATSSEWPRIYDERLQRTIPLADGNAARRITDEIEAKFLR